MHATQGRNTPVNPTQAIKPVFEHRHFKVIAGIIAGAPAKDRSQLAQWFANELAATNPRFDRARFIAAANGQPSNGRDRVEA